MKQSDRDTVISTALKLATMVQANDAAGLRTQTIPEYAKDFSGMSALIANTAPKLVGDSFSIDQLYVLDANNLRPAADGKYQDAQFFCTLNRSAAEVQFLIPALPPGRYAFAEVTGSGSKPPWRISFILLQDGGGEHWSIAGMYPKALDAAMHDGIWYWTHARDMVRGKQLWTAYLYYKQAESLLQPVGFLTSTHLEALRKEALASAPPALSEGISGETPLVVKGLSNDEYRFTGLTTDDSLGADKIDVLVHLQPDPAPDTPPPAAGGSKRDNAKSAAPTITPRERNDGAMVALLTAFPELRSNFHGVWVIADESGKNPFVTEQPMSNIH